MNLNKDLPFKSKYTVFIILISILLFSDISYSAEYILYGEVFAANGTSGTPSTENSFAGLYAYRLGIDGQIGNQYNGENTYCPDKIYEATGSGDPAYFFSDVGSNAWSTPPAAGQVVIAVVQTYSGQFASCAWNGQAYVGATKATITAQDILNSQTNFPDIQMEAMGQGK